MNDTQTPRQEGHEAGYYGTVNYYDGCPYEENSSEACEWYDGYTAGQKKRFRNKQH